MPRKKKDIAVGITVIVLLIFCVCFTKLVSAEAFSEDTDEPDATLEELPARDPWESLKLFTSLVTASELETGGRMTAEDAARLADELTEFLGAEVYQAGDPTEAVPYLLTNEEGYSGVFWRCGWKGKDRPCEAVWIDDQSGVLMGFCLRCPNTCLYMELGKDLCETICARFISPNTEPDVFLAASKILMAGLRHGWDDPFVLTMYLPDGYPGYLYFNYQLRIGSAGFLTSSEPGSIDKEQALKMVSASAETAGASAEVWPKPTAELPLWPFSEASSDASSESSPEASPELLTDSDDWRLRLVNRWNPIPKDYVPRLTQLSNGQSVDERCYSDLQEMMDACRAAGLQPLICSSFRTWQTQEELYENKVQRLIAAGYDEAAARAEAGTVVAVPGTSKHQLGLAVDIVDINNQNLDETQEDTPVQQWLIAHSWEYGWILRYPNDKSDITGIIYEPWHYRYVGKDAARSIHTLGVCLEEYLDMENCDGSSSQSDPSSEQK